MPRFVPDPEVLRLGEALAALRRERGLSQAEAGARVNMTSQGWGLYESGRRPGLFRPDVQRRLTGALDSSPDALALLLSSQTERPTASDPMGVEGRGRAFEGQNLRRNRIEVLNADLSPWAEPGVVLECEPGLWPRRGQGCVIEMRDGTTRVRLFEQADAHHMQVRGAGGLDKVETIERRLIRRTSAIVARLER
jgi:transcriptional regulator with XRE-family HTH domain